MTIDSGIYLTGKEGLSLYLPDAVRRNLNIVLEYKVMGLTLPRPYGDILSTIISLYEQQKMMFDTKDAQGCEPGSQHLAALYQADRQGKEKKRRSSSAQSTT